MAAAKIYQAGVFVVYTESSTVDLTETIAEDTDNYADAVSLSLGAPLTLAIAEDSDNYADAFATTLIGELTLSITEDTDNYGDALNKHTPSIIISESINNFADAIGIVGLDYVLQLADTIPAFRDRLEMLTDLGIEITETNAANLLDGIATSLFGVPIVSAGEDTDNYSDAVGMQLDMRLSLGDIINGHFGDQIAFILGKQISIADTLESNWADNIDLQLQVELTLTIAENADSLSDAVATSLDTRGRAASRIGMNDYIRRYLNDLRD